MEFKITYKKLVVVVYCPPQGLIFYIKIKEIIYLSSCSIHPSSTIIWFTWSCIYNRKYGDLETEDEFSKHRHESTFHLLLNSFLIKFNFLSHITQTQPTLIILFPRKVKWNKTFHRWVSNSRPHSYNNNNLNN